MNHEFRTALHPCSIEIANLLDSPSQSTIIACGCYELSSEDTGDKRNGEILLYEYNFSQSKTTEVYKEKIASGVLDMKFSPKNILAVAQSNNSLSLYDTKFGSNESKELILQQTVAKDGEGLFLSIDISSLYGDIDKIAVSTQEGSIVIYNQHESNHLVEISHIPRAHFMRGETIPAWIVIWNKFDNNILLSGGDDCKIKLWDQRCSNSPQMVNSSQHSAGVTTAQWHKNEESIFVTGSYDETCAIWDYRYLKSPILSIHTGGGVWRSKWLDLNSSGGFNYLATASMQGGCNVYELDVRAGWSSSQILKHQTFSDLSASHLSYGVDAISSHYESDPLVVTCSFYDNIVAFWSLNFE